MPDVRLTTVSGLARLVATDIFGIHMKPNIHPQYREVAFTDMSIGKTFIIRSTADARDTVEIDGVTYPQVKRYLQRISSFLHWRSDTYRRSRPC